MTDLLNRVHLLFHYSTSTTEGPQPLAAIRLHEAESGPGLDQIRIADRQLIMQQNLPLTRQRVRERYRPRDITDDLLHVHKITDIVLLHPLGRRPAREAAGRAARFLALTAAAASGTVYEGDGRGSAARPGGACGPADGGAADHLDETGEDGEFEEELDGVEERFERGLHDEELEGFQDQDGEVEADEEDVDEHELVHDDAGAWGDRGAEVVDGEDDVDSGEHEFKDAVQSR